MRKQIKNELAQLQSLHVRDILNLLLAMNVNHLIDLLDGERSKFTQSNEELMRLMVTVLVDRNVYHKQWNGKIVDPFEMMKGWGAKWHQWKDNEHCPHCDADLRDEVAGPPFQRKIGISDGNCVIQWKCPDCHKEWPRK